MVAVETDPVGRTTVRGRRPGRRVVLVLLTVLVVVPFEAFCLLGGRTGWLVVGGLLLVPDLVLTVWALTPRPAGVSGTTAAGLSALGALVGGAVAMMMTFAMPLALGYLWSAHVHERVGATVLVKQDDRPSGTSSDGAFLYTVRTDQGRVYGPAAKLSEHDLGLRPEVGDHVELYVDPTGILGPEGTLPKARTRRHVIEIAGGVGLAVLALLNLASSRLARRSGATPRTR